MKRWLVAAVALLLPSSALPQSAGFLPCNAATLSVTTTSSNVQLSRCGPTILLMNVGAQEAFFTFGATSAGTVATTSNFSIPGSSFETITVGTNAEWIAAITSTSTTTLRIIQGIGQ